MAQVELSIEEKYLQTKRKLKIAEAVIEELTLGVIKSLRKQINELKDELKEKEEYIDDLESELLEWYGPAEDDGDDPNSKESQSKDVCSNSAAQAN